MSDKSNELECLKKVLKYKAIKGQFAKSLYKKISQKEESIDCTSERPDIIIQTDTEIIGIEHCQVDMLFKIKRKKAQSMVGIQKSKSEKLIEKYKDKDLLEKDIKNNTAVSSILDIIEESFEYQDNFDYLAFMNNFRRVTREHNKNCNDYRNQLKANAPEKPHFLGCLVEIPYLEEKKYIIIDTKGKRSQSLRGIPITTDILQSIQDMKGFDFVILCMWCIDNPKKEKDIVCYYFSPCKIAENIKQQSIKPVSSFELPNAFGLPFKTEIQFPRDMIKKEENNISFTATITKKE